MASDIYTQSDFLMIKIACMYYLENWIPLIDIDTNCNMYNYTGLQKNLPEIRLYLSDVF